MTLGNVFCYLIVFCQFTENNHRQMASIAIITACHRWVAAEGKSPSKLVTPSGSRETISSTLITCSLCTRCRGTHYLINVKKVLAFTLCKEMFRVLCTISFVIDYVKCILRGAMLAIMTCCKTQQLWQSEIRCGPSWSIHWGWILGSCECETSLVLPSQLLDDTFS